MFRRGVPGSTRLRHATPPVQCRAVTTGQALLVGAWLTHWLEDIAARSVRRRTLDGYRTYINRYAISALGAHRLDRLHPEHVKTLHGRTLN